MKQASPTHDLGRRPSKAQVVAAGLLSLIAAAVFGAVAGFLWFGPERSSWAARSLFSALSLASLVMLLRAAFTPRRALSRRATKALSWTLIGFGALAAVAGLLFASGWGRGSLPAAGISCVSYGLAGLGRLRR